MDVLHALSDVHVLHAHHRRGTARHAGQALEGGEEHLLLDVDVPPEAAGELPEAPLGLGEGALVGEAHDLRDDRVEALVVGLEVAGHVARPLALAAAERDASPLGAPFEAAPLVAPGHLSQQLVKQLARNPRADQHQ